MQVVVTLVMGILVEFQKSFMGKEYKFIEIIVFLNITLFNYMIVLHSYNKHFTFGPSLSYLHVKRLRYRKKLTLVRIMNCANMNSMNIMNIVNIFNDIFTTRSSIKNYGMNNDSCE